MAHLGIWADGSMLCPRGYYWRVGRAMRLWKAPPRGPLADVELEDVMQLPQNLARMRFD